MKKTAALLLALTVMAAQTAYAYDIQVDMNAFDFKVSLQSDETTERPTVQMLDKNKTKVVYMGEGTSSLNEDDTYTLSFDDFSVPANLPTGSYIIRIGGKGLATQETTISFVNNLDKANALNELNSASDKGSVLVKDAESLGIDVSVYNGLSQQWKNVVNQAVAAPDLSNDNSVEQVEEKYELFTKAYNSSMELAVIAGSTDSAAVQNMIDASEYLGLDKDSYYESLTDKKSVADILTKKSFSPTITSAQLSDEFDGAVLVSVINQLDWGSAKSALQYYNNSGLVNISFGDFNSLSSTNQANVFKDLKSLKLTDYESISSEFNSIVNRYKNSSASNASGGGAGGGGGGGGSSSQTGKTVVPAPVVTEEDLPKSTSSDKTKSESIVMDFTDMDNYGWAQQAVSNLQRRGVLAGDGTGRFNPQNYVTREEFAKIVVTAFELYESGAIADFEDVPADAWYYSYVASAKKNGVVAGISDTEFGSGSPITRQDMAVMLKRVYDMAGLDEANGAEKSFGDGAQIADYARDAVAVLNRAGILNGDDEGNFLPLNSVTRAQSAQAVYMLVQMIEG